jgi:hypothetical protein
MSTTSNAPSRPSRKMLGYLRYLAEQTGTSFTYPHTAAEAHREIERLRSLKRESKAEIRREQPAAETQPRSAAMSWSAMAQAQPGPKTLSASPPKNRSTTCAA